MHLKKVETGVKVLQAMILAQFSKKDVANYFMSLGVRCQWRQQLDNEDNNKYDKNDADNNDNDYKEEIMPTLNTQIYAPDTPLV